MDNIYLCGFMGTGKTVVGRALAELLVRDYLDTDDLVVQAAGMSIPELFSQHGESHFRRQETEVLRATSRYTGAVVSTGGGLVIRDENTTLIHRFGTLVYLYTPFDICYERICMDSNRPVAASKTRSELKALFAQRHQVYEHVSDIMVSCKDGADITANMIIRELHLN